MLAYDNTCRLILQDEVNCKFEGLPPQVRQQMINAVRILDVSMIHTPAVKMKRWDGKVPFMNAGGGTYIHLLGTLIPIAEQNGIKIELVDQRPVHNFNFTPIDENYFADIEFPVGHHMEGKKILLREHQVRCVNSCLVNPHGIIRACTGAGKTLITAALSKKAQQYGRTIVIVPSIDLVDQTLADYQLVGLDAGVYCGTKKEYNRTHTICTWQSLNALWKREDGLTEEEQLQTIEALIDGTIAVIVDECHKSSADVLTNMLSRIMCYIPLRWGLTGTIPKNEVQWYKILINMGDVVCTVTAKELQDKGYLAKCIINVLQMVSRKAFNDYHDEYDWLVTDKDRLTYISSILSAVSSTGNTLVLVDRHETGQQLCAILGLDPDIYFINGDKRKAERQLAYAGFADANNYLLIATYGVCSTGISINRIFNLVLIESGKSFTKVIQSIGRGLRLASDKDHVDVYDICGTNKYSSKHLSGRTEFYRETDYPYTITKVGGWSKK